jgi:hypothetical protein
MAHYVKPEPDPHRVLCDLAEVIAAAFAQRITIMVEGPSSLEGSTTIIDRRLPSVIAAAQREKP